MQYYYVKEYEVTNVLILQQNFTAYLFSPVLDYHDLRVAHAAEYLEKEEKPINNSEANDFFLCL